MSSGILSCSQRLRPNSEALGLELPGGDPAAGRASLKRKGRAGPWELQNCNNNCNNTRIVRMVLVLIAITIVITTSIFPGQADGE